MVMVAGQQHVQYQHHGQCTSHVVTVAQHSSGHPANIHARLPENPARQRGTYSAATRCYYYVIVLLAALIIQCSCYYYSEPVTMVWLLLRPCCSMSTCTMPSASMSAAVVHALLSVDTMSASTTSHQVQHRGHSVAAVPSSCR